jgi:RND family efflux transporter MFP subunit
MRANLAEITQQWERQKRLVQSGAVAAATAEDLGARVKALEESVKAADAETHAAAAEVTTLNTGLKNMVIVAPIDGTAVTKPFAVGDVVSMMAPTPLVELADFTSLLIETDVPEARLHLVKEGGPCEIVLDAFPDKRYRGVVQEVSPKLNRSKATGTAKVKLVDQPERIRPEMSARVSFLAKALQEAEMKAPPRKIVPGAAVVDRGGTKVVFVVDGGRVRLVNVVLGEPVGSGFELKEGPGAGTRLVKDPPAALKDGEQIKERSS